MEVIDSIIKSVTSLTPSQFNQLLIIGVLFLMYIYIRGERKVKESKGTVEETKAATEGTRAAAELESERAYSGIMTKFSDVALNSQGAVNRIAEAHELVGKAQAAALQTMSERVAGVQNAAHEQMLAVAENLAQQDIMHEYIKQESTAVRRGVENIVRHAYEPLLERAIGIESRMGLLVELYAGSEENAGLKQLIVELDAAVRELYPIVISLMNKDKPDVEIPQSIDLDAVAAHLHGIESELVAPASTADAGSDAGGSVNGGGDRHPGGGPPAD